MTALHLCLRLVSDYIPDVYAYHYGSEILALKAADGLVQRFVHGCRDPLGDQTVQVNRAPQQLEDRGGKIQQMSTATYCTQASSVV